jgi:hypothetical protein
LATKPPSTFDTSQPTQTPSVQPNARRIGFLRGHARHGRPCENEAPMNSAIPQRRPATEEISGLIERVTFHNDESGFCVLRVKARGQREETTVVGSLPSVTAGEWLSAEGWWVRDKEHGLQFKATTMKTVPPPTRIEDEFIKKIKQIQRLPYLNGHLTRVRRWLAQTKIMNFLTKK